MSSLKFVFVFGVLAVSLRNVRAVTSEEKDNIHSALISHVSVCTAEFGVNEDAIKTAKESGTVGTLNPCLMECIFKKIKLMDDKGLFDFDKAEELSKKYLTDEADLKKAVEIINTCKAVNERDAGKGCERAVSMFQCFIPFKDVFLH